VSGSGFYESGSIPLLGAGSMQYVFTVLHSWQGSVYNLNRGLTEKFGRLLVAFADDYREVEEVTAGNIVVLSGLKASHPRIL
jgi:hypothetical protein